MPVNFSAWQISMLVGLMANLSQEFL